MKLHIVIEGTEEEIETIAGHLSDGGGEDGMQPFVFEESGKYLAFDYAKCFPAWGHNPEVDGPDKLVTVTVEKHD